MVSPNYTYILCIRHGLTSAHGKGLWRYYQEIKTMEKLQCVVRNTPPHIMIFQTPTPKITVKQGYLITILNQICPNTVWMNL